MQTQMTKANKQNTCKKHEHKKENLKTGTLYYVNWKQYQIWVWSFAFWKYQNFQNCHIWRRDRFKL
jgi:hypothetical protein